MRRINTHLRLRCHRVRLYRGQEGNRLRQGWLCWRVLSVPQLNGVSRLNIVLCLAVHDL